MEILSQHKSRGLKIKGNKKTERPKNRKQKKPYLKNVTCMTSSNRAADGSELSGPANMKGWNLDRETVWLEESGWQGATRPSGLLASSFKAKLLPTGSNKDDFLCRDEKYSRPRYLVYMANCSKAWGPR